MVNTNDAHAQETSHRKHSSKSLSQPTIPEEGPEQTEDASPDLAGPAPLTSSTSSTQSITDKILATFKPTDKSGDRCKHEARGGKQPGEARRETKASQASSLGGQAGTKVSKSGSFKEENSRREERLAKEDTAKSPKLSRTESMTERTVQKISKMVRGSSRSESRSKKHREPSSSPSKSVLTESEKEKSSASGAKTDKVKEEKKSAQEKREMFKSKPKE